MNKKSTKKQKATIQTAGLCPQIFGLSNDVEFI